MRIVHVDDSSFARRTTKAFLETAFEECEVVSLSDTDFLGAINNIEFDFTFDILITDLLMPSISGHDVLIKCISKNSSGFFVVLSSNVQSFEKTIAYENGAHIFVEKPATLEKIMQIGVAYNERNK